ncbi:ABC transporter substrate-binding protein [Dactylosporangium sp. AC04546]|uniref:ABC transporter substrate-binding protein n=1 Tax=Dactylosporangium sp. AC04546 TaxID=2862460 RepID=UPI001EDFED92|nr:ABC transporter substrate-binding protein [Dactylosporangium sp. AC04546]WVK86831.1 ABC transporter substrate-binding protein [Dactylosporangium sp. AC04546]
MKRKLAAIVTVALASATLAACGGSDSDGAESSAYNVVLVSGVTGALQSLTAGEIAGLKAAAKEINAGGGIDGRKIEITALDSQGDPTKAVNVLQKAITDGKKIDLVYAGIASAESQALLPVLTRNKLLSVATTSSPLLNDPKQFPYHFGLSPTAVDQIAQLKTYVADNNVKTLAILTSNDAFGKGSLDGATGAVKDSGAKTVPVTYDPTQVDLSVAWEKVKAAKPDAVYMDCLGAACAALYRGRLTANATDIPAVGGSGASGTGGGPDEYSSAQAYAKSTLLAQACLKYVAPADRNKVQKAFFDGYSAEGGNPKTLAQPGMLAYDGLTLVANAAKKAGSSKLEDLVKVLESGESPGRDAFLTSELKYSSSSHFPGVTDGEYIFLPPGPIVDGGFKATS